MNAICQRLLLLAICTLLLGTLVPRAYAQHSATATLNGAVRDANGALVTSAQVTVTQNATGVRREATTNDDGFFVITNLPSGNYELKVKAQGFAEETIPNISLQVGQTSTVEVALAVTVQETVILDHRVNYELVNTTNAVVDGVIRDFEIENLPLNGRNFLELALLVPGNSPAPNFDPTKTNTVVISSAGQLGRGGNVTVDGADNNDDVVGGTYRTFLRKRCRNFRLPQIVSRRSWDARVRR